MQTFIRILVKEIGRATRTLVRIFAWIGVPLFGIKLVVILIAKLEGSSTGTNLEWFAQLAWNSAMFALCVWAVVSKRSSEEGQDTRKSRFWSAESLANLVIGLTIIGILAAIALPAMRERFAKEQSVTAIMLGEQTARFSKGFFLNNGKWPTQEEAIRVSFDFTSMQDKESIKLISIADDGTITITMNRGELQGKWIEFRPTVNRTKISWTCNTNHDQYRFPEYLARRCADQFPRLRGSNED